MAKLRGKGSAETGKAGKPSGKGNVTDGFGGICGHAMGFGQPEMQVIAAGGLANKARKKLF